MRPRTHDAHIALKYIEELREFVNAVLAKETAEASDARIVHDFESSAVALVHMHQAILAGIGIGTHGAEFVTAELTSLAANAPCLIEDWPRRIDLDGDGGQQ